MTHSSKGKKRPKKDFDAAIKKFKRWGKWGPEDEYGAMNFITPQIVLEASRLVRKGKIFSLALNFDEKGPQRPELPGGRFNTIHTMLATGTDAITGKQDPFAQYSDDIVTMPLQCGTQLDGLSHAFFQGKMWNGYSASLVDSTGAAKNSIDKMKEKMIGRGVLLDLPRALGVDFLKPCEGITGDDLDLAARRQGVKIKSGDIILIRTGHMQRYLAKGEWGDYAAGDAPGLSFLSIPWIYEQEISSVCIDTWGAEVRPSEFKEIPFPCHAVLLPMMGISIGEIFYLEELARDCAKDKIYDFFFTSAPIPFSRAVGSPINPIAIK